MKQLTQMLEGILDDIDIKETDLMIGSGGFSWDPKLILDSAITRSLMKKIKPDVKFDVNIPNMQKGYGPKNPLKYVLYFILSHHFEYFLGNTRTKEFEEWCGIPNVTFNEMHGVLGKCVYANYKKTHELGKVYIKK